MNGKLASLGLLIMRLGLGASIAVHGYPKMFDPSKWEFLGSQMSLIGIGIFPVFWGFMAGFAEFFGGLLLILGAGTRIASALLTFTMLIAMLFHIAKGDGFGDISHSMELGFVFLGLVFTGAGSFSLDKMFGKGK